MSREEAEAEDSKKKSDDMRLQMAIQKSRENDEVAKVCFQLCVASIGLNYKLLAGREEAWERPVRPGGSQLRSSRPHHHRAKPAPENSSQQRPLVASGRERLLWWGRQGPLGRDGAHHFQLHHTWPLGGHRRCRGAALPRVSAGLRSCHLHLPSLWWEDQPGPLVSPCPGPQQQ